MVTERLSIRSGIETETGFDISGAFRGLEFKLGESSKTFSEQKTSHGVAGTKSVSIVPNATTFFYQKRYKFKSTVWFVNDAWGEETLVVSQGTFAPVTRTVEVEIDSSEFANLTRSLTGSQIIDARSRRGLKTQSRSRPNRSFSTPWAVYSV